MDLIASMRRSPALLVMAPLAASLSFAAGKPARTAEAIPVRIGARVGDLSFRDVTGTRYTSADLRDRKAALFLFLSTECPISNGYSSRVVELAREYEGRGAAIFGVNSNRGESLAAVARHAQERGFPFPVVKDTYGKLARRLGATTTPQAVLLDGSGVVRYRGRIDDHRDPAKVKSRDLRAALDAVLAGEKVELAETKPFGCVIRARARVAAANPNVTYTRDVAPILQANCQGCHRPGEIGPFSLLTYEDASAWAELIKDYTHRRVMPPWKPVEGYGEFQDVRKLTDDQIRTIAEWVDAGAPEGDPNDLPAPRSFTEGWTLGTPDVVLDAGEPYELSAEGPDVYRNFVLPFKSNEDRWVTAVEARPDNRAVVHHIVVFVDRDGQSLPLDAADPGPGYTSSGGGVGFVPRDFLGSFLGGWVPGNTPRFAPPGAALKIPANSYLVLQIHYHKNGQPQRDRTRIGLHFAKGPIRQQIRALPLANLGLQIPPGAERHEVTASLEMPLDITALGVIPHMHLLGREIKVTATLPDGTAKPMVWIKDWDFNWQETYAFKEPMKLPRGTRLDVVSYYDNSEKNPHNPNSPPKRVTWGEETTDEMCLAFIGFTVDSENIARAGGGLKVAQAGK
jgi:peroxiredoxin